MTHLSDTRQTATKQAAEDTPAAIGTALTELLTEHKDVEYATIRITESSGESVSVSGRIGAIVGSRCPRCNGYWHDRTAPASTAPAHHTPTRTAATTSGRRHDRLSLLLRLSS